MEQLLAWWDRCPGCGLRFVWSSLSSRHLPLNTEATWSCRRCKTDFVFHNSAFIRNSMRSVLWIWVALIGFFAYLVFAAVLRFPDASFQFFLFVLLGLVVCFFLWKELQTPCISRSPRSSSLEPAAEDTLP